MLEPWPFALYALTTARITLFIVEDELFAEPRAWVLNRLTPDDDEGEPLPVAWWRRKLAYLLTCIWCVPVWVAALLTWPAAHWWGHTIAVQAGAAILALSISASLLAKVGRDA